MLCKCWMTELSLYAGTDTTLSQLKLLDRIDMHIEVPHMPRRQLQQQGNEPKTSSQEIHKKIEQTRFFQLQRLGKVNSQFSNTELKKSCKLSAGNQALLDKAIDRFEFSSRAYHRTLKVARTIADLADSVDVETTHLTESIGYRKLDRETTRKRVLINSSFYPVK